MKVGVVGAGVIGGGVVRRLLAERADVTVFDLSAERLAELSALGARAAGSAAAAARGADFVLTSLPRDEDVRRAYGGPDGVVAGLAGDAVVLETSTVSPSVVLELAEAVRATGADILDAPVVTSQRSERRPVPAGLERASTAAGAAAAGNLGFLVGGEAATVRRAAPLLETLGIEQHHVGGLGLGITVKLINNAIVGAEVAMLSEMMALARRAGLDLGRVVEVLGQSSANSAVLRSHIARFTVHDNFPDGLFPVDYMVKDLQLAVDAAARHDIDAEVISSALELFRRASDAGLGGIYNPVVIRTVESGRSRAGEARSRPSDL